MAVYFDPNVHKVNAGSTGGWGGLQYDSPDQLDKKYWNKGNTASGQYLHAAQQILSGAEDADLSMLRAYRQMYQSRLGGASAGIAAQARSYGAEQAGQGMSGGIASRILASNRASQAQRLEGLQGNMNSEYGMRRAQLLQGTGNALAGLLVDEVKFGKSIANARRGAASAGLTAGLGAAGTAASSYYAAQQDPYGVAGGQWSGPTSEDYAGGSVS